MIPQRENTPGRGRHTASFGFPSKRQSSRPDPPSYARSHPSPPPNSTCVRPFTSAAVGLHHCPCSTCSPAPIACHTTLPDRLSTAIRLGARGDGTRVCPSFRPFDVHTTTRSPSANTSLLHASCGKTPSTPHKSSSQTTSPPRSSRQRNWHSAVR